MGFGLSLIRSRGRFNYVARRVGARKTYTRKPPIAIPTQASRRINNGHALATQFRVACARVTPNHGVISPAMITTRPSTRSVRGARDAGAAKTKTSPMAILEDGDRVESGRRHWRKRPGILPAVRGRKDFGPSLVPHNSTGCAARRGHAVTPTNGLTRSASAGSAVALRNCKFWQSGQAVSRRARGPASARGLEAPPDGPDGFAVH